MPKETVRRGREWFDNGHFTPQIAGIVHGKDGPMLDGAIHHKEPDLELRWGGLGKPTLQLHGDADWVDWLAQRMTLAQGDDSILPVLEIGTLDRREINHLIRTLRRARDASYGADE